MNTNTETTTTETAANTAEQGASVAPEKAVTKKGSSKKKGTLKGQKGAKGAEPATPSDEPDGKKAKTAGKAKANKKASSPKKSAKNEPKSKSTRAGSNKKAEVIAMMKRAKGVTLAEIMEATGWKAHTVRGFISLLGSKHGVKIDSVRRESDKARVYVAAKEGGKS